MVASWVTRLLLVLLPTIILWEPMASLGGMVQVPAMGHVTAHLNVMQGLAEVAQGGLVETQW